MNLEAYLKEVENYFADLPEGSGKLLCRPTLRKRKREMNLKTYFEEKENVPN